MQKSIIIIGGGIAGLAAGCYARMNGCQTKIFELHFLLGRLCTSSGRNAVQSICHADGIEFKVSR